MPTRLLTRGSWSEAQRVSAILRKETVGGVLLLAAAGAALVWANSPWSAVYHTDVGVRDRARVAAPAPVAYRRGRPTGCWRSSSSSSDWNSSASSSPATCAIPPGRAADRGRRRRNDRARRVFIAVNLAAGHPEDLAGGRSRSPPTSHSRSRCWR